MLGEVKMSTMIKVAWDCRCTPNTTTGWIDGDNDIIYCNKCDGVITTLDKLKMADIHRLDNIQKVLDLETYGERTDHEDDRAEYEEMAEQEKYEEIDNNY